jgi:hypothetical protein
MLTVGNAIAIADPLSSLLDLKSPVTTSQNFACNTHSLAGEVAD